KRANLQQFIGYLHTDDCRRNYIMRYFEEEPLGSEKPLNCCDIDGADITTFERKETIQRKEVPTWESYLTYLLQ
ncbi:ATP-dependent DNA helicase, partial [Listeria ivanovii]